MAIEIQIPFAGFYGSLHSEAVDYAFDQMLSDRETGCDYAPESLQNMARDAVSWDHVYRAYAKEYAKSFLREFDLIGEFSLMTSPREYNFETDRIFVTVDRKSLAKIWRETDRAKLTATAKARHTSRSGFISHYSADWQTWGRLSEWDHNQIATLLHAWLPDDFDQWKELELMESAQCNGRLESWICENADSKLGRALNLWDYLQDRCKREIRTMAQYVAKRRAMNLPFNETPLGKYGV